MPASRAYSSSSGRAASQGHTRGQPRWSTPGVRGWFWGDLIEKKICDTGHRRPTIWTDRCVSRNSYVDCCYKNPNFSQTQPRTKFAKCRLNKFARKNEWIPELLRRRWWKNSAENRKAIHILTNFWCQNYVKETFERMQLKTRRIKFGYTSCNNVAKQYFWNIQT